jgi:FKBP-type peptidyl-prolyl cis-trans isomerase
MTIVRWMMVLAAAAALALPASAQQKTPAPKSRVASAPGSGSSAAPVKMSDRSRVGYAMGAALAQTLRRQGIDIDADAAARGVKDALLGKPLLMTDAEMQRTLTDFQAQWARQAEQARTQAAARNQKQGAAFLAANAKKPGIVTLPSGLQYKVLREGTGPKPTDTSMVTCQYRVTLVDGTEVDSSAARTGQAAAAALRLNALIPGCREALKLMPEGSKWQLFLPPNLAYGQRGAGSGAIGPDATLIFEVELIAVK